MTGIHTSRARRQRVQWQHLLFVKGDFTLSCDVDLRGDGTYAASLFPLWSPEDVVTETFTEAADAALWHQQTARALQAAGWNLLRAGVVTSAA